MSHEWLVAPPTHNQLPDHPIAKHKSPILEQIELLVFDVDGVLTDGSLMYDDRGVESVRFNVRDGFGLRAAMAAGLKVAVLTARQTDAISRRLNEMRVELVLQGADDKGLGLATLAAEAGVALDRTAYLGDDVLDLPALVRSGYPMAVADAAEEVLAAALFVTRACGGRGAAREAVEHVLKAQDKWVGVLERFGPVASSG